MGRLKGKTAIVTGGFQGIGHATSELFVREGATVYAADIGAMPRPAETAVINVHHDVSSESAWDALLSRVIADRGSIDILVNNAGILGDKVTLLEDSVANWNKVLSVNQTGMFLGMRAVLPPMIERRGGSIVNVSSIWGLAAVPFAPAYHATKGAARQLTKNAAVTYAKYNVRVNSVHPGIIETPLVQSRMDDGRSPVIAATPLGRMGQPLELANGILFLASDESSFVTGAELVIDGGYMAQ